MARKHKKRRTHVEEEGVVRGFLVLFLASAQHAISYPGDPFHGSSPGVGACEIDC